MNRKSISKSIISFIAVVLFLSTFSTGVFAQQQTEKLPAAELIGEFQLSSAERTTVVVELHETSIVEAKHKGIKQSEAKLMAERKKIVSELTNKVKSAKVNREYEYLFSGFSVELQGTDIRELLTIPGIKAVYPNMTYTADVISGEVISDDAVSPAMFDSAPYIGANAAWETGFTGEGITVAVIDTGTDYTHPDLAHAFGDYKGYDFVDGDNDPQETQIGDVTDSTKVTNHGTHVAGTVAANGLLKGVAPDASLLAYRVLGPGGRGTTENVIAGIEKAVQDGADVMNLSLGNTLNDPDYATSIALDWAMAEGVVAVTSNGNSGPNNWTVGSPGTSRQAISVGATQLPHIAYAISISTEGVAGYDSAKAMGYPNVDSLLALNGKSYDMVDVGLAGPTDFEGVDVAGKIAFVQRGEYTFVSKVQNAKANGAIAVIMYNQLSGEIPNVSGLVLPTIKLTNADGLTMLEEIKNGNNTVTFDSISPVDMPETVAPFSSRGPVMNNWMIKPDVSAPGVAIISTIPTHNPDFPHWYAAFNGTSMSAPHVAGAAALILDAHPDWGVDEVKSALMNTAEDLIDPLTGQSYPHNTQGAGSIRVLEAINTETLAVPGSHSFGKFVKNSGKQMEKQSFTVKNLSDKKASYSFEATFAGNPQGIKVSLSNNLHVPAGKSQQVMFNVQVDTSVLEDGYYEGTIVLSDGTQPITVPTILFVGEPDYPKPLLTGAYFGSNGDGTYLVGADIPRGADTVAYDLYYFADGAVGDMIGTIGEFTEGLEGPVHTFTWDGNAAGQQVPNGQYALFIYVELSGKSEYKGYLITKD